MIGVKDVLVVLESLRVTADVPLADSIVRAHLACGKTEVDEDLVRQYLIDGGTEIPGTTDDEVAEDPNSTVDEDE